MVHSFHSVITTKLPHCIPKSRDKEINDHFWPTPSEYFDSLSVKKKQTNNKNTQEANCFQAGGTESLLMNKSRKNPG